MGADLYIDSLYEPNQAVWAPQFEEAAALCDSLTPGTPEHEEAHERLRYCHEQMNSRGYFRDPYNDWDVLWQFGLSWWNDVIPMLDHEDRLSVAKARRLLAMLDQREEIFEERLPEGDARPRGGRTVAGAATHVALSYSVPRRIELTRTRVARGPRVATLHGK